MMEDLERLLALKGIAFSRDGNRLRYVLCFVPHRPWTTTVEL